MANKQEPHLVFVYIRLPFPPRVYVLRGLHVLSVCYVAYLLLLSPNKWQSVPI